MRHLPLLLLLACAAASAGCYVVSLAGLADASSAVFDEALVGRWRSAEDEVEVAIERDEWRSYAVTWHDRFGDQRFTGRLADIGGARFFDLTLHTGVDPGPALMPVHLQGRLALRDDTLAIEWLDQEWFDARLARGPVPGVSIVRDERGVLLVTTKPAQWRRWLAAHATSAEVFDEAWTLTRVREVSQ